MVDLLVTGLPVGAMYGLAALGLLVVHRTTGNVDLSLGGVAAAAAYTYHAGATGGGLPRAVAVAVALLIAAGCGLVGAVVARRIGPGRPLQAAVASLAWGGLLSTGCLLVFGPDVEFVAPWMPGHGVRIGGVFLTAHQVLVGIVAAAAVAVGSLVLHRTDLGLAWRACADDSEAALLAGLRVGRVTAACYVLAAVLAGLAGILLVPLLYLDASALTLFFLLKPGAAAVAGLLVSMPGAFVAALAIGGLESVSVKVQAVPGLGESIPLAVAAGALLTRRPVRVRESAGAAMATGPTIPPGWGRRWPARVLLVATLLVTPSLTAYQNTIVQLAVITALLAATHVVLTGWGGQLCLAQPALAGVGAICTARVAASAGLPFPVALVAGAFTGALAAVVLGAAFAARVSGLRFAVLTLAFGAACYGTLFPWPRFAGTGEDRTLPPPSVGSLDLDGPRYTQVVLLLAAATFLVVGAFGRSRLGAALIAGRDHDRAAAGLGLPVLRARWAALILTGAMAGLAGALTAYQLGTVAPEQFHPLTALPILAAAVLGGTESLWGAALGAATVTLAPEFLRRMEAPDLAAAITPLMLLLVVLMRPSGLLGPGSRERPRPPGSARRVPSRPAAGGLAVEGLVVRYGDRVAVDAVDLQVAPGEIVALVGPNGAGKTSVLDAVDGTTRASAGRITVGGTRLRRGPRRRGGAVILRTLQSGGLFGRLTVRDNVAVVARWYRHPGADVPRQLAAVADLPACSLAQGTARLAEVARAAALQPAVLLLDEPAAGMSRAEAAGMVDLVRDLAPRAAVLLVEHVDEVVARADRAIVLDAGRVIAVGAPADVLADPRVRACYSGTDHPDADAVAEGPPAEPGRSAPGVTATSTV